jgi:hypothetical protein
MAAFVEVLPEMQEKRNAWTIALLLQETMPHHQDSGGFTNQAHCEWLNLKSAHN